MFLSTARLIVTVSSINNRTRGILVFFFFFTSWLRDPFNTWRVKAITSPLQEPTLSDNKPLTDWPNRGWGSVDAIFWFVFISDGARRGPKQSHDENAKCWIRYSTGFTLVYSMNFCPQSAFTFIIVHMFCLAFEFQNSFILKCIYRTIILNFHSREITKYLQKRIQALINEFFLSITKQEKCAH